jgi:hypothetical protein
MPRRWVTSWLTNVFAHSRRPDPAPAAAVPVEGRNRSVLDRLPSRLTILGTIAAVAFVILLVFHIWRRALRH